VPNIGDKNTFFFLTVIFLYKKLKKKICNLFHIFKYYNTQKMAIQQRNMNKVTEANNNGYQDTDTLLKKPTKKLILNWNEIPTWMQDNVYITNGYRPQTNSYVECVKSLGYLHNESGKVMDKNTKYKGQG
jgi:hypothetical protein